MYKVGQRVKVTNIESTRWQNFNLNDKDLILNKIFKIVDDLGTSNNEHAWRIETPFGVYNFVEFQFRALKKKGAIKEAKIPKHSLKEEVNWLNKVQGNFKNAGKIQTSLDDAITNYPNGNRMRDIFASTPAQPRSQTTLTGTPLPVPAQRLYIDDNIASIGQTARSLGFDEMQDLDEANQEPVDEDGN